MLLEIRGIPGDEVLRAYVAEQVQATTAPLRVKPVRAEIDFVDENGPKGGPDIRCSVTLRLPRRSVLHVEHLAETHRLAFDQAFARLERQLHRARGREREQRRRPKKYYLAEQLRQAPVEETSAPDALPGQPPPGEASPEGPVRRAG